MRAESPKAPLLERRLRRGLFCCYCLFILYGTFIPFRFSSDPLFVRLRWQHFFSPPFVNGVKQFSLLDAASNVLLFVPFGFLWVGAKFANRRVMGFSAVVIFVTLFGALFSFAIELGQLFSPGRTASILDVSANTLGAALGAIFGYVIFSGLRGALGAALLHVMQRRPALILLALLLIVPLADAYYPFQITLDVSTVWGNLKRTQWLPFVGGFHRYWLDLIVEKVLLFAAIGYLAKTSLTDKFLPTSGPALVLCVGFAFCVEAGKLLFVGRIPNAENFLLAATGALLGVTVVPLLAQTSVCRRHPVGVLLCLVVANLAYSELTPFDWIQLPDELARQVARIEWLPLGAYYGADPQAALFDLGKKLMLAGPLGFLIAAGWGGRRRFAAASAGFLLGATLEALQIFLRSRTASVTDILLFAVASGSGAVIWQRYAGLTNCQLPTSNRQPFDNAPGS